MNDKVGKQMGEIQRRCMNFAHYQYSFHLNSFLSVISPCMPSSMGSSSLPVSTTIILFALLCGFSCSEYIYPNFTASNIQFVDKSGAFLFSKNGTFKAAIYNPGNRKNYYLCVIHAASNALIWSANRDNPVSNYGKMVLTLSGITISDEYGNPQWSTPPLNSSVSALFLTEMGNLVLLGQNNISLWDSFHYPTDTIVIGQKLPVGALLVSSVSDYDLSTANYILSVTTSDAVLRWDGSTYWKLSTDLNAFRNSNYAVEYLAMNRTGLFLFARNGSVVVIQVKLSESDFQTAKLDVSGRFMVRSYSGMGSKREFSGPDDKCGIPFICGRVGFCTDSDAASTSGPICSCPAGFHADPQNTNSCIPSDASLSLPVACSSTVVINGSSVNTQNETYLGLPPGSDYFTNVFMDPVRYGINLSSCKDLCSQNCSCQGIFYENSSGSCFMLWNPLGSIMSGGGYDRLGFIKTVVRSYPTGKSTGGESSSSRKMRLSRIVALLVVPFAVLLVLAALGVLWWKRWKDSRVGLEKSWSQSSPSSGEIEAFSIPGLPVRFHYQELKAATDNFETQIGSGGFGIVYRGTLSDGSIVAVKKITNLTVHGKREFYTEIAVIGNIHHVNLVRLKGFCAHGSERLLVFEYMNRGSLDRTLFGSGPVLEWQERFDIALGTARGLSYLHSGCELKIIHCDVKPENILLQDHFQPKISDFGLSKLLSPEQSSHFTTMRGTRGYLAPEWLTSSAISEKTDVYSFGMVLLEIVSGRKNCSFQTRSRSHDDENSNANNASSFSSGPERIYFPMFALEMHERGRHLELADARLEGRVTAEEVEKLVRIALCCVHEEPLLRPSMMTVVGMLEGRIPLGQPRSESLNFLRFYGRRFTEASTIEEGNGQIDLLLYGQANAMHTSTTCDSRNSISHFSSQQISGPR